jgi:hypothetical protein
MQSHEPQNQDLTPRQRCTPPLHEKPPARIDSKALQPEKTTRAAQRKTRSEPEGSKREWWQDFLSSLV